MRVVLNRIDSKILGRAVVEATDVASAAELRESEVDWIREHQPGIAVVRVPAAAIALVHSCEDLGFRFAECQLELRRRVSARFPVSTRDFEQFEVQSETDLEGVLALAGRIFSHDRFTLDPRFGPQVSGERFQAYVRQSYQADGEHVLALRERATGEIVGFATAKRTSATEMRALLGGVAPAYQGTGLALLHDRLGNNFHFDLGIRTVRTAVSSVHHSVLHLHMVEMGYRVTHTWIVLRKLYG